MVQVLETFNAAQPASTDVSADPPGRAATARQPLWLAVHLPDAGPAALTTLAHVALEFTPVVSPEPPSAVLLEVSGSVRLFGGLNAIRQALQAHISRRGLNARISAAPSALAALWLARADGADIVGSARLADSLSPLPLRVTGWSDDVIALLVAMGVHTVGDCLRLPRDGFARRVGRACLLDLDMALGRINRPRERFRPAQRIQLVQPLPAESTDLRCLLQAAERLLQRAVEVLDRRQTCLSGIEFRFRHRGQPSTRSTLDLVEPVHELPRLRALVHDRFERLALPAPVRAIALRSSELLDRRVQPMSLFETTQSADSAANWLLERFLSRFGDNRVRCVALAGDHRPECASRMVLPSGSASSKRALAQGVSRDRPLWLLDTPRPLRCVRGWTWLSGPERIASGWWEGDDAQRDYYTVRSERGQLLWVYRDRARSGAWYLQGLFG
jgi:protein ImuB